VADCLTVAQEANSPPTIFQQGNMLVRIRSDGDDVYLEPVVIDSLRGFLERAATFGKTYFKDGEQKTSYWPLPLDFVRDILALPGWPKEVFPPINGIARCPFFTADGNLVSESGYDITSKIWLHLAPDLVIDPVPAVPSSKQLELARHWMANELLGDFPFQSDADKANAVAYVLTPFLREMIKGQIPMGLLEAPAAGTGKGLLANAIAIPSLGMPLETIPQRNNDEEWRKAITAKLIELPLFTLFDNLTGTLRSAALEAALTSENWADRMLGETRIVRTKIRTIWLATGNNLQIAGDLFRRIVWIRLDAKMERPEDRNPAKFYHPQLLQWAKANRSKLVWAALTIIRAWIVRGKEPGTEVMGSYESWTATLGGILKLIELNGFVSNLRKNRLNADDELIQLGNFVEAWEKEYGRQEITIGQLFELVAQHDHLLPWIMEPEKDHGRKVRLGRWISKHRDRTVGTYQIRELLPDKRSRCKRYQLVDLTDPDGTLESSSSEVVSETKPLPAPRRKDFPGLLDDRPIPRPPAAPAEPVASGDHNEEEDGEQEEKEFRGIEPDELLA
jgi:hypothetical protein